MINNKKATLPKNKKIEINILDFAKGIDSVNGENIVTFSVS